MWTVQRLIQAGVNRFVLDLPPTPAVAVAGIAFLTRAWGTIIALVVAQHIWGSDVAVPAAILFAVLYTIDASRAGWPGPSPSASRAAGRRDARRLYALAGPLPAGSA